MIQIVLIIDPVAFGISGIAEVDRIIASRAFDDTIEILNPPFNNERLTVAELDTNLNIKILCLVGRDGAGIVRHG